MIRIVSILILIIAIVGATTFWLLTNSLAEPISSEPQLSVLTIKPGDSFSSVYREIEARHLIDHPWLFYLLVKVKDYDKKLQAGEYEIAGTENYHELVDKLTNGGVKLHRLTVPEGYNLKEIASAVFKAGFIPDEEEFLQLVNNPEFVHKLGIAADSMEGYLFPDTYYFPKGAGASAIAAAMHKRFHEIYTPAYKERARELKMTDHQLLTLASIIQKETGQVQEMPLISATFHNRLNRKIRLQSDPTVIYGIKDFNGNLRRRDLETPSPYNTYILPGLPPGPIANPGLDAIKAALYPSEVDYLYFVSRNDGTHQFSSTLKEHNLAVRKYQKSRWRSRAAGE